MSPTLVNVSCCCWPTWAIFGTPTEAGLTLTYVAPGGNVSTLSRLVALPSGLVDVGWNELLSTRIV